MALQGYFLVVLATLDLVSAVVGVNCPSTASEPVVISSQSDADDISDCGVIDSNVTIATNYTNSLTLNNITNITGSLVSSGVTNLTSFSAPDLTIIGEGLEFTSCILLTELSLPNLTSVGEISLEDLPNLMDLNFIGGIRSIDGISIVNTGLNTLEVLEITSASNGINITGNADLAIITFSSLFNVSSLFSIDASNRLGLEVNLPNLAAVQNLTLNTVTSLSMPSLYQVTGQLLVTNSFISNFSTGPIKTGADIAFTDNTFLSNISMPYLASLSGSLTITGNSELKQITGFPNLADILGAVDVTGNYTEFTLPALTNVKGGLTAVSQSQFGGCAAFNELAENGTIQGTYECSPESGSVTSPTTSTSSSVSTSTSSSSSQPSSQPGGGSSLSTGAKAAIGVCIPVGVILLSAMVFWWQRRRRAVSTKTDQANGGGQDYSVKPELQGSPVTTRPGEKPELDAQNNAMVRGSTIQPPVELPNEPATGMVYEISDEPRDIRTHQ